MARRTSAKGLRMRQFRDLERASGKKVVARAPMSMSQLKKTIKQRTQASRGAKAGRVVRRAIKATRGHRRALRTSLRGVGQTVRRIARKRRRK